MSINKKTKKNLVIASVVSVVVVAAALGIWFFLQYQQDRKTVDVVPLMQVTTTYWGDQTYSSGTAASDNLQEIYPSTEQTISDIYVEEGQQVQVGDPLVQYDKTRLELDVESKDLAVKQAEIKLDDAQEQLEKLRKTTPVSTPRPTRTPGTAATPRPSTPTPAPPRTPSPTAGPYRHPCAGTHGAPGGRDSVPEAGQGLPPLCRQRHHGGSLRVFVHSQLHHDPGVFRAAVGPGGRGGRHPAAGSSALLPLCRRL